jgi:hypothetical protein
MEARGGIMPESDLFKVEDQNRQFTGLPAGELLGAQIRLRAGLTDYL